MKLNLPFIVVLTGVWLILLALCALIGVLVVPVTAPINLPYIEVIIAAGKVGISLAFIAIWLFFWYKSMYYILQVEFYLSNQQSDAMTAKDE